MTTRRVFQVGFVVLLGLVVIGHFAGTEKPAPTTAEQQTDADQKKVNDEVEIGEVGYLRSFDPGEKFVYVFVDSNARSDAFKLSKAGAARSSLSRYVACVVLNGTKGLNITGDITGGFSSGMFGTKDVAVIDGPHAGCRGTIGGLALRLKETE